MKKKSDSNSFSSSALDSGYEYLDEGMKLQKNFSMNSTNTVKHLINKSIGMKLDA